jgi:hypothetical protein
LPSDGKVDLLRRAKHRNGSSVSIRRAVSLGEIRNDGQVNWID